VIRIILLSGAGAALLVIAVTIWMTSSIERASETRPTISDPARDFDTTGGQEMRPRWSSADEDQP